VFIHPFTNGNGRFSRLFADFVVISNNQPRFSWGKGSLTQDGIVRKLYIEALKEADNFDYQKLIEFADS
jgi:fido (protein-threonine AMPylation protein)